jgi:hypothetical protein
MSDEIMETNNEATDTQTSQATAEKTYTQEEFDRHMSGLRKSIEGKFSKQFEELGDLNELRALKSQAEAAKEAEAIKAGQFEKILQEKAAKWETEIQKRDAVIKEYKIDAPLLNAAAQYRSVNPEQVKALLKNNVMLGDNGETLVKGADGSVRYNDSGKPLAVDDLVKEFLDSNPHFVQPTPASANTRSSVSGNDAKDFDISKLDMANPEDRAKFAQWKASNKSLT